VDPAGNVALLEQAAHAEAPRSKFARRLQALTIAFKSLPVAMPSITKDVHPALALFRYVFMKPPIAHAAHAAQPAPFA